MPDLSQAAWYFSKDVVLVAGLMAFGLGRGETSTARRLYGPFPMVLVAAVAWTAVEVFNPEHKSMLLGMLGLRSYWLWWIAPIVVASALRAPADSRFALRTLAAFAIGIAAVAAIQFSQPADSALNQYAWSAGDMSVATLGQTGRARVTATFAYIVGFVDFQMVAMPLLLAMGMVEGVGPTRYLCLVAAAALTATAPMTGSRSVIVQVAGSALLVTWSSGILRSRRGWVLVPTLAVVLAAGLVGSSDAVEGVRTRFDGYDTVSRFEEILQVLPPVAITTFDHTFMGIGSGMMQNARLFLGIDSGRQTEAEVGRYLVELGTFGYLLIWLTRLGLAVALVRAGREFGRAGRGALRGAALVFAWLAMVGNLAFDHVFQALFFVGVGLLLAELVRDHRPIPEAR